MAKGKDGGKGWELALLTGSRARTCQGRPVPSVDNAVPFLLSSNTISSLSSVLNSRASLIRHRLVQHLAQIQTAWHPSWVTIQLTSITNCTCPTHSLESTCMALELELCRCHHCDVMSKAPGEPCIAHSSCPAPQIIWYGTNVR